MFNDAMMTSTPDEQEKQEQLENIQAKHLHNISEDNEEDMVWSTKINDCIVRAS